MLRCVTGWGAGSLEELPNDMSLPPWCVTMDDAASIAMVLTDDAATSMEEPPTSLSSSAMCRSGARFDVDGRGGGVPSVMLS